MVYYVREALLYFNHFRSDMRAAKQSFKWRQLRMMLHTNTANLF